MATTRKRTAKKKVVKRTAKMYGAPSAARKKTTEKKVLTSRRRGRPTRNAFWRERLWRDAVAAVLVSGGTTKKAVAAADALVAAHKDRFGE